MCSVGCNQNPTKEQSSISEKKIKEEYDLQERCGKQCEEFFKDEYGNGVIDEEGELEKTNYQYHYNKKLNKCFIVLTTNGLVKNDNKIYKIKVFIDVNENQDYGSFYNIGTFTICNVLDKKCISESEWDLLVKPYMGK